MTDSIVVSYIQDGDVGKINIVSSSKNIEIPTTKFLQISNLELEKGGDGNIETKIKNNAITVNNNDSQFIEFQKRLRFIDCVKDASVSKNNVSSYVEKVYDRQYYTTNISENLVDSLKDKYDSYCRTNNYVKDYTWTKLSKGSDEKVSLDPMLESRVIFYEAGLSPDYFIKKPIKYVINVANEIIDPAARPLITKDDIRFPENGISLNLNSSFFGFFGFDGCSLESIHNQNGYTYKIDLTKPLVSTTGGAKRGIGSVYNEQPQKGDDRPKTKKAKTIKGNITRAKSLSTLSTLKTNKIQDLSKYFNSVEKRALIQYPTDSKSGYWFCGNVEKNKIIYDLSQKKPKNSYTDEVIRGLFLAKEMGDVLQVLIMLVWVYLNQDESYSITTHDRVVYLLCMILQVNCIFAPTDKKSNTDNNGEKIRKITVFQPSPYTFEKAMTRFEERKKSILKDNFNYIKFLTKLKSQTIDIEVSGLGKIKISEEIYDKFIKELKIINNILNGIKVDSEMSTIEIDELTEKIKSNFIFILFIRKNKNGEVKLTMLSKYTNSNELWSDKLEPSIGNYRYGKDSFYKLITNPTLLNTKTGGGNTPSFETPPDKMKTQPIISPSKKIPLVTFRKETEPMSIEEHIPKSIEYMDTEPVADDYTEFPSGAYYTDKETRQTQDLYTELERQINEYLKKIKMELYFDDVYTVLLNKFELNNEVLYGVDLKDAIQDIFLQDIFQINLKSIRKTKNKTTKKYRKNFPGLFMTRSFMTKSQYDILNKKTTLKKRRDSL